MAAPSGRYRILFVGPKLGTGVGDVHLVTLQAVGKANCASTPYCIANEVICGEIGRFLGLPIPPAGVVHSINGNGLFYASLNFNLTGTTLPPINTTECVKQLPRESAGVLLFDIFIANGDRHGRNLAFDSSRKPPVMSVFDHGHALFGKDSKAGMDRLQRMKTRLGISAGSATAGNRHCLLDQIKTDSDFGFWLERIRVIPDFVIDDVCEGAEELGCSKEECKAAAKFLKDRRVRMDHLIEANKDEFTGIENWRLFR